ncbi:MAG: hypothetical protein ABSE73_19750 [Planctomycetota bacterium]
MNLYFLVEGRHTERKVYPKWMSYLLPHFRRVDRCESVDDNSYFLISGEGYPSLLDNHLEEAITNINNVGRYAYLVLCLDAEELSVTESEKEVLNWMKDKGCRLENCELRIVVQNRCIESWLLGNRRIVTRAPQSKRLAEFIQFYDVKVADPETMGRYKGFTTHAQFHGEYLEEVFREKGLAYSHKNPGHAADESFLNQLLARIQDEQKQMATFRSFVDFCRNIRSRTVREVPSAPPENRPASPV